MIHFFHYKENNLKFIVLTHKYITEFTLELHGPIQPKNIGNSKKLVLFINAKFIIQNVKYLISTNPEMVKTKIILASKKIKCQVG